MNQTTLRLEKDEKLDGRIMFYIMEDNHCIKSIEDDPVIPGKAEETARKFFDECKQRQANGYPKITVLAEIKF